MTPRTGGCPPPVPPGDLAADRIVASVRRPFFPPRNFPVTRFGAVGDGTTKNTKAFAAAIAACHRSGGGHVIVPAGTFLTGAIHLLSHVDLHVEAGATVLFSQDPNDCLPVVFTRWQGIELMNYSPFVYSYGQRNIAVTGSGTLNGQADANHWWNWKSLETPDFNALEAMADAGTPVSQRVFNLTDWTVGSCAGIWSVTGASATDPVGTATLDRIAITTSTAANSAVNITDLVVEDVTVGGTPVTV